MGQARRFVQLGPLLLLLLLLSDSAACNPPAPRRACGFSPASICATGEAEARILFDQRSPFSRVLVVENEGMRCLKFGRPDANPQSCMDIKHPAEVIFEYVRYLSIGAAFVPEARRGLMIGLGGGSAVRMLLDGMPALALEVVELDPQVCDAARRHFDLPKGPRLRIIEQDGRAFLEQGRGPWDLVLLDAFGEEYIPFSLATVEFMRLLDRQLAPGGAVVANLWKTKNSIYRAQLKTFHEVFPGVQVFEGRTSGNAIVVATREPGGLDPARLQQQAQRIAQGHWTFNYLEPLEQQVPLDRFDLTQAPVFRDAEPAVYEKLAGQSW